MDYASTVYGRLEVLARAPSRTGTIFAADPLQLIVVTLRLHDLLGDATAPKPMHTASLARWFHLSARLVRYKFIALVLYQTAILCRPAIKIILNLTIDMSAVGFLWGAQIHDRLKL